MRKVLFVLAVALFLVPAMAEASHPMVYQSGVYMSSPYSVVLIEVPSQVAQQPIFVERPASTPSPAPPIPVAPTPPTGSKIETTVEVTSGAAAAVTTCTHCNVTNTVSTGGSSHGAKGEVVAPVAPEKVKPKPAVKPNGNGAVAPKNGNGKNAAAKSTPLFGDWRDWALILLALLALAMLAALFARRRGPRPGPPDPAPLPLSLEERAQLLRNSAAGNPGPERTGANSARSSSDGEVEVPVTLKISVKTEPINIAYKPSIKRTPAQ